MSMTGVVLFWGLIAHVVGDYLLQSDWMALEKTKAWGPAWAHAFFYGLPFLVLLLYVAPPWLMLLWAMMVIVITHAVIDHYRLVKYLLWAKNLIAPAPYRYRWEDCKDTGYHTDRPVWMSVWLMIIADNCLHVVVNSIALSVAVSTV